MRTKANHVANTGNFLESDTTAALSSGTDKKHTGGEIRQCSHTPPPFTTHDYSKNHASTGHSIIACRKHGHVVGSGCTEINDHPFLPPITITPPLTLTGISHILPDGPAPAFERGWKRSVLLCLVNPKRTVDRHLVEPDAVNLGMRTAARAIMSDATKSGGGDGTHLAHM